MMLALRRSYRCYGFLFFNTRNRKAKREKSAEDWIRSLEERSEGLSEILLAFFSTSFFARLRLFFYDDDDDDDDDNDDDSCVCSTPSSYRQPYGR